MCILLFSLSVFTTYLFFFFFSSRRRHTRLQGDWSSDVCSSDLIAQAAKLRPIADIAAELGLAEDEVELYGKYKAKVRLAALAARKPKGRLVLVTGINPTPAGEGKSTVTVGVTQALRRLGKNAALGMREPS